MRNTQNMGLEFCFMIKDNPYNRNDDIKSLFDESEIIYLEQNNNMSDVVAIAGIYDSKSQAKKDGWNKPIEDGYSEFVIGKLKTKIYIWNPKS